MKRTTMLIPMLAAFLAGGVVGGRLLSADAQPAPKAAGTPCDVRIAKREAELRREKNAGAEAREAAATARIRDLEKVLAKEQARRKKLQDYLSNPDTSGGLN
jgi:hypothetical protein